MEQGVGQTKREWVQCASAIVTTCSRMGVHTYGAMILRICSSMKEGPCIDWEIGGRVRPPMVVEGRAISHEYDRYSAKSNTHTLIAVAVKSSGKPATVGVGKQSGKLAKLTRNLVRSNTGQAGKR